MGSDTQSYHSDDEEVSYNLELNTGYLNAHFFMDRTCGNLSYIDFQDSVDSRGIAGWGRVADLVDFLLGLEGPTISNKDAARVIELYNQLHEFDRTRTTFQARARKRLLDGRFAVKKKNNVTPGVESTRR